MATRREWSRPRLKRIWFRRRRECQEQSCGHQWTSDVVLSAYTTNLSGEVTEYCPRCGGREVTSGPCLKPWSRPTLTEVNLPFVPLDRLRQAAWRFRVGLTAISHLNSWSVTPSGDLPMWVSSVNRSYHETVAILETGRRAAR